MKERYSFMELKNAQGRCTEKSVELSLIQCADASKAQKEVVEAHINDMCASLFCSVLRNYDPLQKGAIEELDRSLVDNMKKVETALRCKESNLNKLRQQIPMEAVHRTRERLQKKRKFRETNSMENPPVENSPILAANKELEFVKVIYEQTVGAISDASIKLNCVADCTQETIQVVVDAIKRPKSKTDNAMIITH